MANPYVYRASSKSSRDFSEKEDFKLEGTMIVLPHVGYKPLDIYNVIGTGSLFDGPYVVRKVTHKYSKQGYEVELGVERTVINGDGYGGQETGNTKTRADKVYTVARGDTAWNISERFCKSSTAYREWYGYNGWSPVVKGSTKYWYVSVGQQVKIPGHLLK